MKKLIFTFAIGLAALMSAVAASAQEAAKLHFEQLNGLDSKARDVVEVNIDGKLLELAKRVSQKVNDADAIKVREALKDLRAIYVRVYRFENEGQYNPSDVDQIRSQLNAPGWEKLANVRSKQNDQKVDVYTMFTGDKMDGLAVVMSDSKSVALVNVVGMIDIETLVQLSGKLSIPKINVDLNTSPKAPSH
jgi:hypothetical protein